MASNEIEATPREDLAVPELCPDQSESSDSGLDLTLDGQATMCGSIDSLNGTRSSRSAVLTSQGTESNSLARLMNQQHEPGSAAPVGFEDIMNDGPTEYASSRGDPKECIEPEPHSPGNEPLPYEAARDDRYEPLPFEAGPENSCESGLGGWPSIDWTDWCPDKQLAAVVPSEYLENLPPLCLEILYVMYRDGSWSAIDDDGQLIQATRGAPPSRGRLMSMYCPTGDDGGPHEPQEQQQQPPPERRAVADPVIPPKVKANSSSALVPTCMQIRVCPRGIWEDIHLGMLYDRGPDDMYMDTVLRRLLACSRSVCGVATNQILHGYLLTMKTMAKIASITYREQEDDSDPPLVST